MRFSFWASYLTVKDPQETEKQTKFHHAAFASFACVMASEVL